jgi:hypothetical protein
MCPPPKPNLLSEQIYRDIATQNNNHLFYNSKDIRII